MSTQKVLISLLAGVATGAVLGILFAPAKGSRTRRNISRKSTKTVNDIKDKFTDLMDEITEKFETGKEEIGDAFDKIRSKAEKHA